MGNQSIAIERYPLPGIRTRMCSEPLQFAPAVRYRHGLDLPIPRRSGRFLQLLRLLCQQVSQPNLFSRWQFGNLCENVLDSEV